MKNKRWKIKYGKLSERVSSHGLSCLPLFTFHFSLSTSRRRGVATLPTVILLGIMALVVAVGITTLSFSELMISQGGSQSSRALFYAESGARDALLKIARNKNYECVATDCYTVYFTPSASCTGVGGGCAKVSVGAGTTSKIATSTGVMGASTRTMRVSVTLDTNGQIATSTTETVWTEI